MAWATVVVGESVHSATAQGAGQYALAPGRHLLQQPLALSSDMHLVGSPDGSTAISGGLEVGPWRQYHPSRPIWSAPLPHFGSPRQLWVDGARAVPARFPDGGFLRWQAALPEPFARWGLRYESSQGIEGFGSTLVGAHVVVFWSWTASRHRVIAHLPANRTLIFDRPSRQPLGHHLEQSGRRFVLEAFAGALDAPGEFAVSDDGTTLLYHANQSDLDLNRVDSFVATAGLRTLLVVEGSHPSRPLRHVTIENVTIEHVDWDLPKTEGDEGGMADWQARACLVDASPLTSYLLPLTFYLLPSTSYLPPLAFCLWPLTCLLSLTFHLLPSTCDP